MKTLTRWDTFLGDIATGMVLPEAMKKNYFTRADIETCTRIDETEAQRWTDAVIAGRKRNWSVLDFDDIFGRIAEGMPVKEAVTSVKGDPGCARGFHYLITKDPDLKRRYREAMEARTLMWGEQIVEISDNNSEDVLDTGGKSGRIPNGAAVNRSKLQVDTRWRVMGAHNARLYGEKRENVQVNVQINHAERLEEARERARNRGAIAAPVKQVEAVDAQFSEVPAPAEDTEWMNDKPTDAIWREET